MDERAYFVVGAKELVEIETTAAELLRARTEIEGDVKAAMDLGEMTAVARNRTALYFMVGCYKRRTLR